MHVLIPFTQAGENDRPHWQRSCADDDVGALSRLIGAGGRTEMPAPARRAD
jgi:hypothetical protein